MSSWDSSIDQKLLKLYVGTTHNNVEELGVEKEIQAKCIVEHLNINNTDTVLDIGPGLGFIASFVSPYCEKLICTDISSSFLAKARDLLQSFNNVECRKINHGDLSAFRGIDKIYCLAVFIHFNIYDVGIYLEQVYNSLKPGGKFLFDFLDADNFDPTNEVYQRHKQRYTYNKDALSTNINFNSKSAVEKLCIHYGFDVQFITEDHQPWVVLTKQQKKPTKFYNII